MVGETTRVTVQFAEHTFEAMLASHDFGRIRLILSDSYTTPYPIGTESSLVISTAGSPLIAGPWRFISHRVEDNATTLVFEHPALDALAPLSDRLAPDLLFNTSRLRVISLTDPIDHAALSQHFTELKDFLLPVTCDLKISDTSLTGTFDFSSGAKELTTIDISLPVALAIQSNSRTTVEYTLLGTRYLFQTQALTYDSDFQLLSLVLPSNIIAITARSFDRIPTKLQGSATFGETMVPILLSKVSSLGAEARLQSEPNTPLPNAINIRPESCTASLPCTIVHRSGATIGLRFSNSPEYTETRRQLLMAALPQDTVVRTPKDYPRFINIYRAVGYAPTPPNDTEWELATQTTWTLQDQRIPGTCTGAEVNAEIISSIGTLPFTEHTVYGHSACMVKTARSASTFLEQACFSLAWADLLPNITHYVGSYAKHSKFTTRLQVIFETHAAPSHQLIVHTNQLFPDSQADTPATDLKIVPSDDIAQYCIDSTVRQFITLLASEDPYFKEVHSIRKYVVLDTNKAALAVIVDHSAPEEFTAAGMFNYSWLILLDTSRPVESLCGTVRANSTFRNKRLQVLVESGRSEPPAYRGPDHQKPAFWTFTPKDEFGPILSSMSRAVYSVLRKYGEEGLPEITRLF